MSTYWDIYLQVDHRISQNTQNTCDEYLGLVKSPRRTIFYHMAEIGGDDQHMSCHDSFIASLSFLSFLSFKTTNNLISCNISSFFYEHGKLEALFLGSGKIFLLT